MKTIALILSSLLCLLLPVHAQKISDMTETLELDTDWLVLITVPGVTNYKSTVGTLSSNLYLPGNNVIFSGSTLSVKSNISFYASGSEHVFGSWGIIGGWSNAVTTDLLLWNTEVGAGNDLSMSGTLTLPNIVVSALAGSGASVAVNPSGLLYRTNITGGSSGAGTGGKVFLDATLGNDSTATRTNDQLPFLTVSNAIAAMQSGDTLVVRPGTYLINPKTAPISELNMNAGVALTNKSNIRITGEPGAIWQMRSRSTNFAQSSASMLLLVGCTNVMIDKITMIGIRTNGVVAQDFAIGLRNSGRITIADNIFDEWECQGIYDASFTTVNSDVEIRNNWFTDIGGTNKADGVGVIIDGTAVDINCSNLWIHGNHFRRNLRDWELYEQGESKNILFENNDSYAVRDKSILFQTDANLISDVAIINNKFFAGATNAVGNTILMDIWSVSNLLFAGNVVDGFYGSVTYGYTETVDNSVCVDVQIYDNTFKNMGQFGIYMLRDRASPAFFERVSIMRNKFANMLYYGVSMNASHGRIEGNEFQDCAGAGDASGVITVGHNNPPNTTNSTNITIIGNKIYTRFFPNGAPGIVVTPLSYSNIVWGNEVHFGYTGGPVVDNGTATKKMPLNLISPGKLLASDTNSRMVQVVVGTGLAYDSSTATLSVTGAVAAAGGNSGDIQFKQGTNLEGTNSLSFDRTNQYIKFTQVSPVSAELRIYADRFVQHDADRGMAFGVNSRTNLFIRDTFGNVGIGTPVPHSSASLDVTGAVYAVSAKFTNTVETISFHTTTQYVSFLVLTNALGSNQVRMGVQDLTNSVAVSPSDGEALVWNSGMKKWTNGAVAGGSGSSADVVSNITVSATNNVLLDFAAANVFKLALQTNTHITVTNQNYLAGRGAVYFLQDTNGFKLLAGYKAADGVFQTNAASVMTLTTNALGLDLLEIMPGFFVTNVLAWWPQDFQPRIGANPPAGTTTASDDFDRGAANPLNTAMSGGGTWELGPGSFGPLQGNFSFYAYGTSGFWDAAMVSTPNFADNHSASVTIAGDPGDLFNYGPAVRVTSGATSGGYVAFFESANTAWIREFTDSGGVISDAAVGLSFSVGGLAAGMIITLEASGSNLTLKTNGVTVGVRTDATWTTGQPGVATYDTVHAIDNFTATDL